MRTFVVCFLSLVVLCTLSTVAEADSDRSGAYQVVSEYVVLSGTSCDGSTVTTSADPRRSDGGAADVNGNAMMVYNTHQHSLAYKYEAANSGSSFVLTLQAKTKWNDWVAFSPAVTVTCAGASGSGCVALSLPACTEIRVVRSSDATYATTLSACVLNKF
jgi:hypothetical protein